MKKNYLLLTFFIVLASGCSKTSDYAPAVSAGGEEIFQAACAECHKDASPQIFELEANSATLLAVKQKIAEGNIGMPKFPHIQGEALDKLAEYVIENSVKK